DGNIWDKEFLSKVDTLFAQFEALPAIDTVISPTRLEAYRRRGMNVSAKPLMVWDNDSTVAESRERLATDSILYYNFFSENREWMGGLVIVEPSVLDSSVRDSISVGIRKLTAEAGMEHVISGVPYIRTAYVEKIRGELTWFISIAVVLTLLVMFFLYRNWWGMLFPQLGVGLAMIWTLGFMGLTGKNLDMVSELLPSIIFVVGIADMIHLLTRYQQDIKSGLDREAGMRATLGEIGMAIFLTSVTTAIGFASLYVSPLPPVRSFGLVAAVGVIFAYIVSIILIPNLLMLVPAKKVKESAGFGNHPIWERKLGQLYEWVRNNGVKIAVVSVLIIGLSIVGTINISTNTYLLDDIKKDDPAWVSMRFFEDNFYGARAFEMAIVPKNGKEVTDQEIMEDVEKLQEYIRSQERISPFLSIVNYVKGANRLRRGSRDKFYRLPKSQDKIEELVGFGYLNGAEDYLDRMMNRDRTVGRLSAQMGDIGSDRIAVLWDSLSNFYNRELRTENFQYVLTGTAVITDQNVNYLREGLFTGLALAFGLIAILMGLLFRSWRMLLVGVIPNIIPLLITAGVMGFMGITLRASTSIVFLVAFGIAVDDTIHFLSRVSVELREGRGVETALRNATVGTGKALILTTVILLAGFVMLLTSDFGGTFVVGFFTALTLLVALLSDLLLVPVLIRSYGDYMTFETCCEREG
ncbi:MAG: MMPL family transporter, partial [Bacteroidota bacterium]